MGGLQVEGGHEVDLLTGGVLVGDEPLVGRPHRLDDPLALKQHREDVLQDGLVARRVFLVLVEGEEELLAGREQLGALGLFLLPAFLDFAGPLAEEQAGRLEGGGVVLEHVGAVDQAAGRLMHDARDDVADAEFLAGDGARAGDGFDLPIHGPRMSPRGLGGQPHSPGIGADLLTVSGQPVA